MLRKRIAKEETMQMDVYFDDDCLMGNRAVTSDHLLAKPISCMLGLFSSIWSSVCSSSAASKLGIVVATNALCKT